MPSPYNVLMGYQSLASADKIHCNKQLVQDMPFLFDKIRLHSGGPLCSTWLTHRYVLLTGMIKSSLHYRK